MTPADEELVDLIGAFYDAVIDQTQWSSALERLRKRFDFYGVALAAHRQMPDDVVLQVTVNIPPDFAARLPDYASDIVELWGGPARWAQVPIEEPLLISSETTLDVWDKTSFYHEWVRPQGIVDQVGILLSRDAMMSGSIGLPIHESRSTFSEEDKDAMRLLAPHLRRAVVISGLLETAADNASTFRAALDATRNGVVLVDPGMRILHSNVAANGMLAAGDPLRATGGRLALRREIVPGQLQAAVRIAAKSEADLGRRGTSIPARRLNGNPVSVSILPLERRNDRSGLGSSASAAVFISDAAAPPELPADAMRLLYDLSAAEQRVFTLVVEGRGTAEVASALRVGASTVRTQLLSIFGKTGCRNRADLVRLARSLAKPA